MVMVILGALLILLGAIELAAADCGANRLALVLPPTAALSPKELQRVRDEVDRIWRPLGLEIVWRSEWLAESDVRQIAVSFVDRIDGESAPGSRPAGAVVFAVDTDLAGPILLSVPIVDGLVTSARVAGIIPERRPEALRRTWLTRALARILAHEVGHVVLRLRGHRRHGLMKSQFHTDELLDTTRQRFGLVNEDRAWRSAGCQVLAER
jgi:hypothetical protein